MSQTYFPIFLFDNSDIGKDFCNKKLIFDNLTIILNQLSASISRGTKKKGSALLESQSNALTLEKD